jgi:hypothetical protein
MGIDLGNDGVTLNDRGDGDSGANNLQNFPVLNHVIGSPARLVVQGSIDTPNPTTVTIEIYANASPVPGPDYTGYGEGQRLIGTARPDAQGNTSEFALDAVAG